MVLSCFHGNLIVDNRSNCLLAQSEKNVYFTPNYFNYNPGTSLIIEKWKTKFCRGQHHHRKCSDTEQKRNA